MYTIKVKQGGKDKDSYRQRKGGNGQQSSPWLIGKAGRKADKMRTETRKRYTCVVMFHICYKNGFS